MSSGSEAGETSGPGPRYGPEAALARFLLRQRRRREELLGAYHFSDPVWDIMLDLFAAQVRGEEVAISSLIVAANVPQSTALRRIRQLVRQGELIARDDPHDGRRTFICLSADLFERIGQFLRCTIAASGDRPAWR